MIPRSLTARVVVGALLVVSVVLIGGGLTIVTLTKRRDERDAQAELARFAAAIIPPVAQSLGVPPPHPPPRRAGAPPPAGLPPPPPVGPPAGNPQQLLDTFNQGGGAGPAGPIEFVRALADTSGHHLTLGKIPHGFPPMSVRPGTRTVTLGGKPWLVVVDRMPPGVTVEVAAMTAAIADRAAHLRTIVLWTVVIGLLIALVGTVLVTRLALRPLTDLAHKAARVEGTDDLETRLRVEGQPREVAVLADELDGMLGRLDDAVAARETALLAARRFAADAGHELRTPLQSVRANLDIAMSAGANDEQRRLALESAALQSQRLNRLVDGLQTLARGESGLIAQPAAVDVGDIADGAVFATRTRHPELSIECDLPAFGPVVDGDADGLWRVVENLLENAARHGRAGGCVRLHVSGDGGAAEIVIDDDGPGIPPHERERVVRRFARGSGTTAAGSGLGLAIVEAEARRHGGSLELSASDLGGLRARVTIHESRRDSDAVRKQAPARPPAQHSAS